MDAISEDNRKSSIVLIISFAVFVLSIYLMEWDALTAAYYGVHEVICLVYGLGLIVLPVEGIVWLVIWRRYIRSKYHSSVKTKILNGVSFLLFVVAIILPVIAVTTVRTGGTAVEIEKYSYRNQYYISLDHHSIQVSKEKYDEIGDGIELGYVYTYEYANNDLFLGKDKIFWVEINKIEI